MTTADLLALLNDARNELAVLASYVDDTQTVWPTAGLKVTSIAHKRLVERIDKWLADSVEDYPLWQENLALRSALAAQRNDEEWRLRFLEADLARGKAEREVSRLREEAKYHDEADALRKLRERERDEARKYAEERNDEANKLQRFLNMAAQERDEAHEQLAWQIACTKALMESQERLAGKIKALRAKLEDACNLAEEGWAYADEYYQTKWRSAERIAALRALPVPEDK